MIMLPQKIKLEAQFRASQQSIRFKSEYYYLLNELNGLVEPQTKSIAPLLQAVILLRHESEFEVEDLVRVRSALVDLFHLYGYEEIKSFDDVVRMLIDLGGGE
jgi:hypothetical protein